MDSVGAWSRTEGLEYGDLIINQPPPGLGRVSTGECPVHVRSTTYSGEPFAGELVAVAWWRQWVAVSQPWPGHNDWIAWIPSPSVRRLKPS